MTITTIHNYQDKLRDPRERMKERALNAHVDHHQKVQSAIDAYGTAEDKQLAVTQLETLIEQAGGLDALPFVNHEALEVIANENY